MDVEVTAAMSNFCSCLSRQPKDQPVEFRKEGKVTTATLLSTIVALYYFQNLFSCWFVHDE